MKKIFFIFITFLIVLPSVAQTTFDNEFYFRFGYSNPSWKQFGADKDWWEQMWDNKAKKWGVTGEIGTIFMLKTFGSSNNMAFGLDVTYLSVYYQQFSYEETNYKWALPTLRLDSKVGPSFTISPVKRLAIDIYLKADVNWYTLTSLIEDDDLDEAEVFDRFFCLGLSTGVNVRYSILMVGFEFNTLSPKLENIEESGWYFGSVQDEDAERSPLPSVNFTIGLSF